jgi:hypothetical protein
LLADLAAVRYQVPGDQDQLGGVVGGRTARPATPGGHDSYPIGIDLAWRAAFPWQPERIPGRERQHPGPDPCGGRHGLVWK